MGLPTAPYPNRGPIDYTSISSPVSFPIPIRWIHVVSAGSGGLVVKDEGGDERTYAGLGAGEVLFGPFAEITSMTLTKIRVGDGPAPSPVPVSALLGSTVAGNGAALVGIADAGTFTAQTTVEGAVQEIYQDLKSALATIPLPPQSFYLLTGAPLAVFADGATTVPGSSFDGSKNFGVRWNNDAAPAAIAASFQIPADLDITANATLHIRAAKTGATNNAGNTPTFAVGVLNQVDGALYDADTDFGGTTSAMLPAATAKTIQNVTLTLTAADLAASPASATITIKPTAGTLNTDDLIFVGAYITYQRKLRAS